MEGYKEITWQEACEVEDWAELQYNEGDGTWVGKHNDIRSNSLGWIQDCKWRIKVKSEKTWWEKEGLKKVDWKQALRWWCRQNKEKHPEIKFETPRGTVYEWVWAEGDAVACMLDDERNTYFIPAEA
jgi:hypothetical protein